MVASLYMALGAALSLLAFTGILFVFGARLRRHLQKNLKDAIGQQLGLSRRMTEIIIQLQQNQSKQDEQMQKLAEFSLRLKKDMALLVETQQRAMDEETESPNADTTERPKYLN